MKRTRILWSVLLPLILVGCARSAPTPELTVEAPADAPTEAPTEAISDAAPTEGPPPTEPTQAASLTIEEMAASLEGLDIDTFFDESYHLILLRSPQLITELGIAPLYGMRNDQLDDKSDEYEAETIALKAMILDQLRTYDRASLTPEQATSYDVYEWWLVQEVAGEDFIYHDYPVNFFLNGYPDMVFRFFTETHPLSTAQDAEDYVACLQQTGRQVDQMNAGLTARAERGIFAPDSVLAETRSFMLNQLGGSRSPDAEDVALFTHFRDRIRRIDGLSADEKDALLESARTAVEESFIPAYLALLENIDSVSAQATSDLGLWRLPDGDAYYQYLLRQETSTDLTPQEIHDLGLREVDRIHAELEIAFAKLGYDTDEDINILFARAREDAGFITGEAAILAANEAVYDQVEAELPRYFDVFPAAELVVVPDPYGGFYMAPSLDGSRPGAFHAGTTRPQARFNMATIAYHEGIPGHHFQIAIAGGLDQPLFRNIFGFNSYVEGWALYAERLAYEMGMYDDDPYGNIGRLQLELLRAVRLVTDTGIHSMGWSRQEARDYMGEAIGGDWIHEVERYTVWPAQATGYMIGMLTILDARDRAQAALGDRFDIVAFHHVVLTNGSLPLAIFDAVIDEWIASQQ